MCAFLWGPGEKTTDLFLVCVSHRFSQIGLKIPMFSYGLTTYQYLYNVVLVLLLVVCLHQSVLHVWCCPDGAIRVSTGVRCHPLPSDWIKSCLYKRSLCRGPFGNPLPGDYPLSSRLSLIIHPSSILSYRNHLLGPAQVACLPLPPYPCLGISCEAGQSCKGNARRSVSKLVPWGLESSSSPFFSVCGLRALS